MEYGLIGKNLSHSFSPELHREIGDYKYELKELSPNELSGFFSERNFKGINVTIPYKETVIPFLDEISDEAKAIGSVNTVINENGKLFGYNTDFYGLSSLIKQSGISLRGKSVLILGTGGTSKTAACVSEKLGAKNILKVSRSGNGDITYEEAYKKYSDTDIIINTTPCGMSPNIAETPVELKKFGNLSAVIDVIYNPVNTSLICEAKELGIPFAGGLYMLVSQAVKSAELFGFVSKKSTEEIYNKLLKEKQNIVLIGMPSCGKTTVGKILSEKLERKFFDSDTEIEKATGKSVPEIFAESGEGFFRAAENTIIAEKLALLNGAVIATGGGVILSEENMRRLSQNGKIYFLDRPKELLFPTYDRPTASSSEKIEELYYKRIGLYKKYSDIAIDASKEAEETAAFITEDFLK